MDDKELVISALSLIYYEELLIEKVKTQQTEYELPTPCLTKMLRTDSDNFFMACLDELSGLNRSKPRFSKDNLGEISKDPSYRDPYTIRMVGGKQGDEAELEVVLTNAGVKRLGGERRPRSEKKPMHNSSSSMSYVDFKENAVSLFGHHADRRIVSGIRVDPNKASTIYKLIMQYQYDGGTVGRPYDRKEKGISDTDREKFKTCLDQLQTKNNSGHGRQYNEVLASIIFPTDGSASCVIGDKSDEAKIVTLLRKLTMDRYFTEHRGEGDVNIPVSFLLEGKAPRYFTLGDLTKLIKIIKKYLKKSKINFSSKDEILRSLIERTYELRFKTQYYTLYDNLAAMLMERDVLAKTPEMGEPEPECGGALIPSVPADGSHERGYFHQLIEKKELESNCGLLHYLLHSNNLTALKWYKENIASRIPKGIEAFFGGVGHEKFFRADQYDQRLYYDVTHKTQLKICKNKAEIFTELRPFYQADRLLLAAKNGHLDTVEHLLGAKANVDTTNKYGATPLHYAAQESHAAVVKLLLERGADASAANNSNATPLHYAAKNGHLEVVKLLLEGRANVNASRKDGITPLFMAAQEGHLDVVKALLDAKAKVNTARHDGRTPLFMAAQQGHLEVVKLLLEGRANVNAVFEDGRTPLFMAAQQGHLEVVKLLLEGRANVNASRKDGITPLFMAAQEGHLDVVKALLEAKASVNAVFEDGRTPLFMAAQQGHLDVVKALLEAKASVNAANAFWQTSLHIAAQKGHLEVVKLLLARGANVNAVDENYTTPLLVATNNGHLKVVKALLQAGADADAEDIDGITPLYLAKTCNCSDFVECFNVFKSRKEYDWRRFIPIIRAAQQGSVTREEQAEVLTACIKEIDAIEAEAEAQVSKVIEGYAKIMAALDALKEYKKNHEASFFFKKPDMVGANAAKAISDAILDLVSRGETVKSLEQIISKTGDSRQVFQEVFKTTLSKHWLTVLQKELAKIAFWLNDKVDYSTQKSFALLKDKIEKDAAAEPEAATTLFAAPEPEAATTLFAAPEPQAARTAAKLKEKLDLDEVEANQEKIPTQSQLFEKAVGKKAQEGRDNPSGDYSKIFNFYDDSRL